MAPMTVHAIRGAVQVSADDRSRIMEATVELVTEIMTRNELTSTDVVSVLFTTTPDLTAEFPAKAARKAGLDDVPLLCASEIAVPGAMPRVVRLLAHVDVDRGRTEIRHVYLGGAEALRPDLEQ
ncbi:chorismate mutase [Catenuloplanes atrovinosus]|uniref:chorismate mutase n=1 Tax=Catenuloplanes atrovinosus TaxID=137266 RepID=A0AAE3YNU1_9ACTN|nr:chorismate mutase [Catenuloplanes atrovinosus]MDR7276950.1 chorismate mutase [Catenuloplanes atrovinosus]